MGTAAVFLYFSLQKLPFYFWEWQDPCMAQCAQLQPQEDFPCFFCRIKDRRMRITMAAKARQIKTVPIWELIHCSMANHSFD